MTLATMFRRAVRAGVRRRAILVALGLLGSSTGLAVLDACTIVNGLTVPEDAALAGETSPPGDAGVDADPCDPARPPPRPQTPDTAANGTIVAVVSRFILTVPPPAIAPGFDLDNTCSCLFGARETCRPASASPTEHCDTAGGRDNAATALFRSFQTLPGATQVDLEKRVNASILMGKNTLLVRVTGFNGTADDPEVTVSLFASLGLYSAASPDDPVPPAFVESERWSLDSRQFTDLSNDIPKTFARGWVAGGKLVALVDTTIDLSDNLMVTLKGGMLQADIDRTGAKPAITGGTIAGRWPATDMLRVVGRLRTQDGGPRLCENSPARAFIKAQICDQVDITASAAADNTNVVCDALSTGVGFEAKPASLGDRRSGVPDEPCPGEVPDDCAKDGSAE